MKSFGMILALATLMTGCQTINVQNGPDASKNYTQDEWHHIGILELVEYSDPVDLRNRCGGKAWTAVRTRQSVGQVFLGLVPYLGFFWTPREVAIACKE